MFSSRDFDDWNIGGQLIEGFAVIFVEEIVANAVAGAFVDGNAIDFVLAENRLRLL